MTDDPICITISHKGGIIRCFINTFWARKLKGQEHSLTCLPFTFTAIWHLWHKRLTDAPNSSTSKIWAFNFSHTLRYHQWLEYEVATGVNNQDFRYDFFYKYQTMMVNSVSDSLRLYFCLCLVQTQTKEKSECAFAVEYEKKNSNHWLNLFANHSQISNLNELLRLLCRHYFAVKKWKWKMLCVWLRPRRLMREYCSLQVQVDYSTLLTWHWVRGKSAHHLPQWHLAPSATWSAHCKEHLQQPV